MSQAKQWVSLIAGTLVVVIVILAAIRWDSNRRDELYNRPIPPRVERIDNGSVTINMDVFELRSGERTDIYRTVCIRPKGTETGIVVYEHAYHITGHAAALTTIQLLQPDGRPMTCNFNDPKPTLERSSL